VAETADLKSLARRVLQRDTARDNERDSPPPSCRAVEAEPRQQIGGVSLSRFPGGETPRQVVPPAYAPTLAALECRCPDHIDTADWRQAVEDGRRFLAQWGEQAAALGWTARDLFGLHSIPEKPAPNYRRLSRYDETGLIWLLHGMPVKALTATTAAILNPTGAITTYRRHDEPAFGPVGDSLDDFDP
jgi:hypothetical protein